jgi:capsular polysaccharide transport system permease protein
MAVVQKRSTIAIWKDVIFAIFLREIKSKFNDRIGISWAVISPVAFIMVLSFIRGRMGGEDVHTIPVFIFMMYGMVIIQLFLTCFGSCANAIKKNKPLYAFRQVQPISSVIAIALFEYLVKVFVVIILFLIIYLMDIELHIDNLLMVIICLSMVWLFSIGLGLIFAIAQGVVEELSKVRELATRPMFFISGVFFSLQDIPKEYWKYLDWNPILHAIELTRFGAYESYGANGVSFSYLSVSVLIVLAAGLFIYQAYWKQVVSR